MAFSEIYLTRRNPSVSEHDWPRTWRSHAAFAGSLGIGGPIELMLYCARDYEADAAGLSTDYDGVALLSYASRQDMVRELPEDVQTRIDQDELRVFERNIPNVTVFAKQTVVTGGEPSVFVVLRFFGDGSVLSEPPASAHRFVQHSVYGDRPEGYEFSVITESWFETEDDALADVGDESALVTMLARAVHRWPR